MTHEGDPSNRPRQTQLNERGTHSPSGTSISRSCSAPYQRPLLLDFPTQFQIIIALFDPVLMEKGTEILSDGSARTIRCGFRNAEDIELGPYTQESGRNK